MKKITSLYYLIISILLLSFVLPVAASADERTTGTLTIDKYEQEPGAEPGEGDGTAGQTPVGTPLAGVTYKVKQTHAYDGTNWEEVADGPEYMLKTDKAGQISKTLDLGRYSVQEIDGPPHVNLNPTIFHVDIPMTSKDGKDLNYDVHIYPKNEKIRSDVQLTKTDGDTKESLAGVQFELYHADGTQVADTTTFATDGNGKITVSNLAYGDYYFKEVATIDGYLLGNQKVEFSIEESGTTVEVGVKNYVHPDVDKNIDLDAVNRGEIVTYTITVELPGDINKYKSFVVTDKLHENLEYVDGSATSSNGFTFTYDKGTRTLTWTGDPAALEKGTVTFTFKAMVSEEAEANVDINNKASIDYTNEFNHGGKKETDDIPVKPTAGSLTVIKKDKSNKKKNLAGAEFELRDAEGNVIETGTTDRNGRLVFKRELDFGNYTLHETKAPDGYRKLTKPIDITIDAENQFVEYTVFNSKSGWELPKTGGIGTIMFTFVGLTLMSIAVAAYFRRNRVIE